MLAGAEPIRIKEKQSYEWLEGEVLKIVSIPIVQVGNIQRETTGVLPCQQALLSTTADAAAVHVNVDSEL